jgi:HPt (histidine-containing phosphotransfer) domain-containing protein
VADEPVIDESVVDGLRRLGPEVHGEILQLWFDNLGPTLDLLRHALAEDDRPALVAAAHTLRGSAANVGAARLAAVCAELEAGARRGDGEQTQSELLAAVVVATARAREALTVYAQGRSR